MAPEWLYEKIKTFNIIYSFEAQNLKRLDGFVYLWFGSLERFVSEGRAERIDLLETEVEIAKIKVCFKRFVT